MGVASRRIDIQVLRSRSGDGTSSNSSSSLYRKWQLRTDQGRKSESNSIRIFPDKSVSVSCSTQARSLSVKSRSGCPTAQDWLSCTVEYTSDWIAVTQLWIRSNPSASMKGAEETRGDTNSCGGGMSSGNRTFESPLSTARRTAHTTEVSRETTWSLDR